MRKYIVSLILLIFLLLPVTAYDMNITVNYPNGTAVNNAYVTLLEYNISGGPPTLNHTFYNFTNSNGLAYLKNLRNSSLEMYSLSISANSTGVITHQSPLVPFLPAELFQYGLSGETIFVEPAVTFNFTVNNGTAGSRTNFGYDVLDNEFGDFVTFLEEQQGSATNLITLPKNRNYTFNLYANAPPITLVWTNASDYTDGSVINYEINGTVNFVTLAGNISGGPFDEFTGINWIIQGDRIFEDAAFSNIGTFMQGGSNDTYNATSGFFNVTLPAMSGGVQTMLAFFARSGAEQYILYYNVTKDLTSVSSSIGGTLNLTPLYGLNGNISIDLFDGSTKVINTSLTTFNISSTEGDRQGLFAEFNLELANSNSFMWNSESDDGLLKLAIPNGSTATTQIFASSTAPVKYKFNPAKLSANNQFNISVASFEGQDMDGNNFGAFDIDFYTDNSTCNIPDPESGCSLFNFGDFNESAESGRESVKMMFLTTATVSMKDTIDNVSVTYVGVDLRSAGAPPASMDTSANESNTSGGSMEEVWRFGSVGPEVYDFVYVTIPYNDSAINESQDINISIDSLYDTSNYGSGWSKLWDSDNYNNLSAANAAAAALSDYSARFSEWSVLINETACQTNQSVTGVSNPCYINTSSNLITIRIPHFSGAAPKISGAAISSSSSSSSSSGSSSSGSGGGSSGASGGGVSFGGSTSSNTSTDGTSEIADNEPSTTDTTPTTTPSKGAEGITGDSIKTASASGYIRHIFSTLSDLYGTSNILFTVGLSSLSAFLVGYVLYNRKKRDLHKSHRKQHK